MYYDFRPRRLAAALSPPKHPTPKNHPTPNTQRPRINVGIRTDAVYERYRSRRDDQNNVWSLLPRTPRRRVIAAQTPNAQGDIDWLFDWLVDYFNQVQANPYPGGDPAAAHEE